jgi:ubiquinone/menaquinone biosynthesis C-methylase UbiE
VTGIDPSSGMLAIARERIPENHHQRISFVEGDAERIPLPDASVDVITSAFALQLVPDRTAALREMRRVLRPGGVLAMVTWTDEAAGFIGEVWGALWLWLAIGLLVVELAAMYALAAPYYMNLRRALTDPTVPNDEVVASMSSSRPIVLAWVGIVGLLLIVWLMVVKPF